MLTNALYLDNRNQAFYTDAQDISSLMGHLLGCVAGKNVLEPAVGRGAFLSRLRGEPARLDAVDVDADALAFLAENCPSYVRVVEADFIRCSAGGDLLAPDPLRRDYDAVISNPPYGLRFSHDFRRELKAQLGRFYVRESYGLFLRFSIERLVHGGRYVFIVPDTFLTSNNHRPLREFLAANAPPTELILFNSRRFGTVQFGYGSFCIIAGYRAEGRDRVSWLDLRGNDNCGLHWPHESTEAEDQATLLDQSATGWVPPTLRRSSKADGGRELSSLAECRTGIYTGDNARFLGYDPGRAKRQTNGHSIVWREDVLTRCLTAEERAKGVTSKPFYVPLARGGHRQAFDEPAWAIDWSAEAVEFYRTNKKARLQNAKFYFRTGLGVPMVTSGRISASMMTNAVFDQGVVGIFPHDERLMSFLLLYLNSKAATDLKRAINPGANNSARYIGRIDVPAASDRALLLADDLVGQLRASSCANFTEASTSFINDLATSGSISPLHSSQ